MSTANNKASISSGAQDAICISSTTSRRCGPSSELMQSVGIACQLARDSWLYTRSRFAVMGGRYDMPTELGRLAMIYIAIINA